LQGNEVKRTAVEGLEGEGNDISWRHFGRQVLSGWGAKV
jgi:hypothetical protein